LKQKDPIEMANPIIRKGTYNQRGLIPKEELARSSLSEFCRDDVMRVAAKMEKGIVIASIVGRE